jgi:hypothetical protein
MSGNSALRGVRSALILVSLALLAGGCAGWIPAGIRGVQEQVTAKDLDDANFGVCPSADELKYFDTAANFGKPEDRAAYRNQIIGKCLAAADRKFAEFTTSLRMESTTTKLGIDAATLTLGGLIAAGGAGKAAGAATTGLLGFGAAIDKDVYFQQTMPALISAMQVSRNQILAKIALSEQASGDAYPLIVAAHDVWEYQNASNIDSAIRQLTTVVGEKQAETAGVELPPLALTIVPPDVQIRRVAMFRKVDALHSDPDRSKLDQLAALLGAKNSDKNVEYAQIKHAIIAQSTNAADMDKLAATVQPVLGQE